MPEDASCGEGVAEAEPPAGVVVAAPDKECECVGVAGEEALTMDTVDDAVVAGELDKEGDALGESVSEGERESRGDPDDALLADTPPCGELESSADALSLALPRALPLGGGVGDVLGDGKIDAVPNAVSELHKVGLAHGDALAAREGDGRADAEALAEADAAAESDVEAGGLSDALAQADADAPDEVDSLSVKLGETLAAADAVGAPPDAVGTALVAEALCDAVTELFALAEKFGVSVLAMDDEKRGEPLRAADAEPA